MSVLAFFLCACVYFVRSESSFPVNQEEKPIICLNKVNGKIVRGFKNVNKMEWENLPCHENGIDYCGKVLMNKENQKRCIEVCCAKGTPSPTRSGSWPSPAIAVETTGHKNETSMRPKREEHRKITDNSNRLIPAVVISFLIGLSFGLAICGICVYRKEKVIKRQNKMITQPILQPMDSAEDPRETCV